MPLLVIEPGVDRRLRDEAGGLITGPVPVETSLYWTRRIADGDAVIVDAASPVPVSLAPLKPAMTRKDS